MIQSTEIRNLILRWYESYPRREISAFASSLFSNQEGFLIIGSDQTEWIEHPEGMIKNYRVMESRDIYKIKVEDLKAYCENDIGWAVDRVWFVMPDGSEVPMRHTYILHKEEGAWKVVHVHASIGVPNAAIGYTQS